MLNNMLFEYEDFCFHTSKCKVPPPKQSKLLHWHLEEAFPILFQVLNMECQNIKEPWHQRSSAAQKGTQNNHHPFLQWLPWQLRNLTRLLCESLFFHQAGVVL